MLTSLTVKNIVLVDELQLDFTSGLAVLTGETGAGKTILLNANGLAVGERGNSSLKRQGTTKASVSATFEAHSNHKVWELLDKLNVHFEVGDKIILNRTITTDGKSRASINGSALNVGDLKMVGDCLVDVQGQFDQQGLLSPAQHLYILDSFAETTKAREYLKGLHIKWRDKFESYKTAMHEAAILKQDAQYINHCLKELEQADILDGEFEQLKDKKLALKNATKLLQAYQGAYELLSPSSAAVGLVGRAEKVINKIAPEAGMIAEEILKALDRCSIELNQTTQLINNAANHIKENSNNLQKIEDRIYLLKDLARKHRVAVEQLPDFFVKLQNKATKLTSDDEMLKNLKNDLSNKMKDYYKLATALSEKRKVEAENLCRKVNMELPALGLGGADFMVNITMVNQGAKAEIKNNLSSPQHNNEQLKKNEQLENDEHLNEFNPKNASLNGIDKIQFFAKINSGANHTPINKSASGGELSRLLLALNVSLAKSVNAKTLMFDEVDAGVGGKSAAAIGRRLLSLGKIHQVFVITHSPQVAGAGNSHFYVEKNDDFKTTTSTIKPLSYENRQIEIARMLSGDKISDEAMANAKILLTINEEKP